MLVVDAARSTSKENQQLENKLVLAFDRVVISTRAPMRVSTRLEAAQTFDIGGKRWRSWRLFSHTHVKCFSSRRDVVFHLFLQFVLVYILISKPMDSRLSYLEVLDRNIPLAE